MFFNKGVSGDEVVILKSKYDSDRIMIHDLKYLWESNHVSGSHSKIINSEVLSADGNFYPIHGITKYKNPISCLVKTNTSSIVIGDDGEIMVESGKYGKGVKTINQIDNDEVIVKNHIKLDYDHKIYCEGLAYLAGLMFFSMGLYTYIQNLPSIIDKVNNIKKEYDEFIDIKIMSKSLPNLGSYCRLWASTNNLKVMYILTNIHNIFPMLNHESQIEFFAGLIDNYATVKSGIPYVSVRNRLIANYLTTMAALAGIDVSYCMYKYNYGDKIRIGIYPKKELKREIRDIIKKRYIEEKNPIHLGNIQKANIINVTGNYVDKYLLNVSNDEVICSKHVVFV